MKKRFFIAGVTLAALLFLALPVAAARPSQLPVADDGACVASIRSLSSGVYQVWVYCYGEGGYYPAGTAMHLVAAPTDHPSASVWGEPVDLTLLPGDVLDNMYFVKENAISPVAVAAKTGSWEALPGWLLQTHLRLRDRTHLATQGTSLNVLGEKAQTRLQNEERQQEETGRRIGETEANRFRVEMRERSETNGYGNPFTAPSQAQNGPSKGNGQGRR